MHAPKSERGYTPLSGSSGGFPLPDAAKEAQSQRFVTAVNLTVSRLSKPLPDASNLGSVRGANKRIRGQLTDDKSVSGEYMFV